jgi:membrane associated rhomboid family serine protease
VAFIRLQHRLPRLFSLLFVLAGALNAAAYVFDLWDRIGIYDEFVHFYTTFAVAGAFGYFAFHRPHVSDASYLWRFVAVVTAFGFGVGVLWEVFEWAIGIIGDWVDTVVDLAMDTLGAAAAGLFCAWAVRRQRGEQVKKRLATLAGLST